MMRRFHSGCFVWGIALMVWAVLTGSAMADGTTGRLVAISGDVWIQPPQDQEFRAQIGKQLLPGTRIRTGDDGKAEIEFEDGSTLVVQPKTALVLSGIKRQKRKKTSILVFFGRIWNKVTRAIGPQARYDVNTPVVVAGVRGTEFETAVADDGTARVRVISGRVAVSDQDDADELAAGQEVEVGIDGIGPPTTAEKQTDWSAWQAAKRERLRTQGRVLVDAYKRRILSRKDQLEALRNRQKTIEANRQQAIEKAKAGNAAAIEQVRQYNEELIAIADDIADLGDATGSQFGLVDHFGRLAADPKFQMIDGKYVESEAAMMRRIKALFDEMIAEGTDISMEAMDKMLREMSEGQRGSLKFDKGSSKEDLFGDEPSDSP